MPWEDVPKHLIQPKTRPRKRRKRPEKELLEALEAGDEDRARELLATGANPNARAFGGRTAMDFVRWGKVSRGFARELVDAGYDPSKRCGGYNALQSAIWADDAEFASLLLSLGASPTGQDGFRRTPLTLAAYAGASSCLELLIQRGVDDRGVATALRAAERRLSTSGSLMDAKREAPRVRKAVQRLKAALPR